MMLDIRGRVFYLTFAIPHKSHLDFQVALNVLIPRVLRGCVMIFLHFLNHLDLDALVLHFSIRNMLWLLFQTNTW